MKSIKASLILGLLLGFGLLLAFGGYFLADAIEDALVGRFDAQLRSEAMTILSVTKQERDDIDVEFTDRYLREYDDDIGTRFFQVTRIGGKMEDHSESLGGNQQLSAEYGTTEDPRFYDLVLPKNIPGRAIGFEFVPHSEGRDRRHHDPNLKLGLVVAADRRELDVTLAAIRSRLLAVAALSFAGTFLVVALIVGLALRPVRRFTEQIESMNANDLSARVDQNNLPGELHPIATGLNDLLRRLHASFQREKQFSSDIAHELRTPIAELRSLSEVALKWPQAGPAANEAFRDTLGIARQMDGIVSSLLAIRRAEVGHQGSARTSVSVAEIVNESWKPLEQTAELRQLNFSAQIPSGAVLETDRYLFGLILKNLLENAVYYTPRRGSIRFLWESVGTRFSLSVANPSHDLNPEDIPRLFDRFWRKESARSTSEHSGLGLALARAYAQTLGYDLTAELLGRDIVFTLTGARNSRTIALSEDRAEKK